MIRKRDWKSGTTWQVIVEGPRDPRTGERSRLSGTAKNERAAKALEKQLVAQAQRIEARATSATLADLWADYWEHAGPPAKATRNNYLGIWRNHIEPALGAKPLRSLKRSDVKRLHTALERAGKKAGTVQKVHTVLSAVLSHGVEMEWLGVNVAHRQTPASDPKVVEPTPKEVIGRLIAKAVEEQDDRFALLLRLSSHLGTRKAETLGIQWRDLDLEAETVTIRRRVTPFGVEELTKTGIKGVRTIAIAPWLADILRVTLVERQAEAAVWRGELQPDAWVLASDKDPFGQKPWNANVVGVRMRRLCKRAGVTAHLHGFRHHVATELLSRGVDVRIVAERLGDSPTTILKTYSHFVPSRDRQAAALLEDVLV